MDTAAKSEQVFISYARYNYDFVQRLVADLKKAGINVWLDTQDLKAGTPDWEAAIREAICASQLVLLVASRESRKSPFVRDELLIAESCKIPILPIWAKGEVWIDAIPMGRGYSQYVDCRDKNYGSGLETILEKLTGTKPDVLVVSEPPSEKQLEINTLEKRNRQVLLSQVKRAWIDGVLKSSVFNAVLMELNLISREDFVYPWLKELGVHNHPNYHIPQGTTITDIFDRIGGDVFLITGEPGSGKTTTLLELAEDLIERAEKDADALLPIVLNLSSWTEKKTIRDWIIFELTTKYQVPSKIGENWIDNQNLILLLDGLDEVSSRFRNDCVDAVNTFHATYTSTPMVVCCRVKEFEALKAQLQIKYAIHIQPLVLEQALAYLEKLGSSLDGLRTALQKDQKLQELVRSPLLLSIMALTFQGMSDEDFQLSGTFEDRQKQLFDTYVERMLARPSKEKKYSPSDTLAWLKWLAQRMTEKNETVFQIERLQPDWISTDQEFVYELLSRLPVLILAGIVFLCIHFAFGGTELGILLGVPSGLLGLLEVRLLSRRTALLERIEAAAPAFGGSIGCVFGALAGVITNSSGGISAIASNGYGTFLISMAVGAGVSVVLDRARTIKPIEKLSWSWVDAQANFVQLSWLVLVGAILAGVLFFIFSSLTNTLGGIAAAFATLGFVISGILLTGGLVNNQIDDKTTPNQGIKQSVKNAAIAGILFGVVYGLFATIGGIVIAGIVPGIKVGLISALVFGFGASIIYGGTSSSKHLMLRMVLNSEGHIPQNYAHFLDYCVKRILLQRAGGAYIFIHRSLQEHFAQIDEKKILRNLSTSQ